MGGIHSVRVLSWLHLVLELSVLLHSKPLHHPATTRPAHANTNTCTYTQTHKHIPNNQEARERLTREALDSVTAARSRIRRSASDSIAEAQARIAAEDAAALAEVHKVIDR